MFEARLEKDHESSIQVALRLKLILYEFTQKLDHEMKLTSGWTRGTTIEWFLVVFEERGITHRYNWMQLEVWKNPYNLSVPKTRYRYKQGFILDIK